MAALRSLGAAGHSTLILLLLCRMYYVYLLQSSKHPNRRYIGFTEDLRTRIKTTTKGKIRPRLLIGYDLSKGQTLYLRKRPKPPEGTDAGKQDEPPRGV